MTAAADAPLSAFFINPSFPDPPNGRVSLKYRISMNLVRAVK